MSHPNTNKWTPAIYSKTSPVNWTAERNKSINWRLSTAKQNKRNNVVSMTAK
jgi:hypothetical protein